MARLCLQLNTVMGRNLTQETGGRKNSNKLEKVELPDNAKKSRILILGGTGRVGGSTAIALSKFCPDLRIVIAGRNRDKGAAMVPKLGNNAEFSEVDINDSESLDEALKGVDLVVHTAGPFQQASKCIVLEAAIQNKVAYLDVCDDTSYAQRAKSYMNSAIDANVPAITTGGIYPGVSNVMAAELVRAAKTEGKGEPERLRGIITSCILLAWFGGLMELIWGNKLEMDRKMVFEIDLWLGSFGFYYYTAGSGGAGPTILSTSFLLLGEEVVAYNKGEKIKLKPYSGMLNIDFGEGIGKKDVFLLNLPEVRSIHEVLGIPTVSARFGTAPFFWNWGMVAMTYLFPPETLRDRSKVQELVDLFDPLVRAVDGIAGERVSMRVDLDCSDGRSRIGIFSHRSLSQSVGVSIAAFVLAILEGNTKPGVWFPEEPQGIAVEARETLLSRAAQGTINFIMNKAPWMVETNPKEIGFGIYD